VHYPRRTWLFAFAAAVLLALAGSLARADAIPPRDRAAPRLDGCVSRGPGVEIVSLKTSRRSRIRGAILGAGTRGVVLSNQSQQNLCSWLPVARKLVENGFRVLLYDYGYGTYRSEVTAAARALRRRGVRRVGLMGSSQGGKVALHAASWKPTHAVAVVDVSGERYLGSHDIRRDVLRIRIPSLFVASENDAYGAGKAARLFYKVSPSKRKRLILLPGDKHGFELFDEPDGPELVQSIVDFLKGAVTAER
jgi:pimeloyl-ACP methyl ester carboxylesterase